MAGAFLMRRSWRLFRSRFDKLCLEPILDYAACQKTPLEGAQYRFTGGFESLTDGKTLWIRSETLTIPVVLAGAHTYLLPMPEGGETLGSFDPGEEAPERIRWDRISTLTGGAKVFVGGLLCHVEDRWTFVSTKESPLLVIFYDGPDHTMATRAIRAGRHRNEYWNRLTPYGFMFNAFFQILIALSFLSRPAFRLTALCAFIALFAPIFPLLPPGVLLTVVYRRLWWRARIFRAYRDLARLPLKYLSMGKKLIGESFSRQGRLPDGEVYGAVWRKELPGDAVPGLIPGDTLEKIPKDIPLIIPEQHFHKGEGWYIFGVMPEEAEGLETPLPVQPRDPFAAYGAIPGEPEGLAERYTRSAYILEITGGLILLVGIGLNLLFVGMILYLLAV
ncbi:hypothetical protein TREPR_3561 [Treponema primitia ZAS-2]|uniref:Uncharacterized protein n=1 Tax=Treponema primitia (strain ATCC BAA-887 / DSM 12427 / ZAS-2) TaxID=545694 RepID=F5YIB4_TREPZ|nr:hypothetical protein TREPR_3561 [Treponema primitia ZAS-2]